MNMIIKVADFGLSVNTGAKEYYRLAGDMGVKLPVMWMAPESLSDYIFSEKSDVVSKINIMINHCHSCTVTVELWSDMLGNIYRRPSSLRWH